MKNTVSGRSLFSLRICSPSPAMKLMVSLIFTIACILFLSVVGYQRDLSPFPFSPSLRIPAPGAKIPPRLTRFLIIVLNASSFCVRQIDVKAPAG